MGEHEFRDIVSSRGRILESVFKIKWVFVQCKDPQWNTQIKIKKSKVFYL